MVEFQVERMIAASPERAFDWLADPANLTAAPVILKVRWVKGSSGPGEGALREAIGLGGWFREQITAYDRPRAYSYRVVRSIPPLDHEGSGGHQPVLARAPPLRRLETMELHRDRGGSGIHRRSSSLTARESR
jgi:hypothetical protein